MLNLLKRKNITRRHLNDAEKEFVDNLPKPVSSNSRAYFMSKNMKGSNMKEANEMWNSMTEEEKQKYKIEGSQEYEAYRAKLIDYLNK